MATGLLLPRLSKHRALLQRYGGYNKFEGFDLYIQTVTRLYNIAELIGHSNLTISMDI